MKKIFALTIVVIAAQVLSASAGEPVTSSKEVVAPAAPPPESYFRANEFSIGLFAAYDWTRNDNVRAIGDHAWGGGIDGQYFLLRYLGFSVDGNFFNEMPGDFFGSTVTGNVILRYPLDLKYPNFHLAPYVFGGVGGVFNSNNVFTRAVTFGHAQSLNRRNTDDEVLGDAGAGLEYRFTPHIGVFSDFRYQFVNESKNNFMTTRFGLRFAF
ncbi:MAG: outer membrane beta-barrel protein [Verrucomicrobia bacterium]|nr:outer membrane beta-barrel protein [Verrucomicrobiota bacterium]